MGTGSHRAQLESAAGKRDRYAGITHARALKSHSKLKFRQALDTKLGKVEAPRQIGHAKPATRSDKPEHDSENGSDSAIEDEYDASLSSEAELERELQLLTRQQNLRKKLEKRKKSSWRSESTFNAN